MSRIFDYAFFDFDGTIADTKEGIFNALKYAFKSLGLEEPPESELCKMIGPPLRVGFEETFGFKGELSRGRVGVDLGSDVVFDDAFGKDEVGV